MTIRRLRPLALGIATLLAVPAAVIAFSAGSATAAACPTVDPVTKAVTPAPSPGVDWSGCNLTGAELANADLSGANLANTTLSSADLTDADLSGATLTTVIATGTNFTGADLDTDTVTVVFNNANLSGVSVNGTDLSNSTMLDVSSGSITGTPAALPFGVTLTLGYLIGMDMNLSGASLSGVDLSGRRLDNSNLSRADLSSANLKGANLEGGDLENANFDSADLTNADLDTTDMNGAKVDKAILTGASMAEVKSGGLAGTPASLPANFAIVNEYFIGPAVDLTRATLGNADLSGLDMESDSLGMAIFIKSNLTDADLTGAFLNGADFTKANLTGADLTDVTAQGTTVTWSDTTCPDGSISEAHVPDSCLTPFDTKPPVADPAVAVGAAGASGWYHSAVTVAWNWTDDGTLDLANCTQSTQVTSQGADIPLNASCADMNGNIGSSNFAVSVDTTPPTVSVTGVGNNKRYVLGAVPVAGCSTSDSLSGVATQASVSVREQGTHGTGLFTATCAGGADVAGNTQAAPVALAYTVLDGFGGYLAPKAGTSLAKKASAIAVKFRLVDASGQPIPAAAAAALGKGGKVKVTLAGPGIAPRTAACAWAAASEAFLCTLTTPPGVRTGKSSNYTLTVDETVGTGLIKAPVVGSAANPETIHFR